MSPSLKEMIRKVTELTRAGRLTEATAAIQRALHAGNTAAPERARMDEGRVFEMERAAVEMKAAVVDEPLREKPAREKPAMREPAVAEPGQSREAPVAEPEIVGRKKETGAFLKGRHTEVGLTREYMLFAPPGPFEKPPALVVMLHGCTQDPADFARGTQMNRYALEQGFFVLYPAQAQDANPMRCWNWFKTSDQGRAGEPAVITGMVREVLKEYGLDEERVYVAGLSAGGAMAAVLANAYPDVYAAAGVHSGLAPGAATNVMVALSVMKRGAAGPVAMPRVEGAAAKAAVPVIAFQGDADDTVHARNGEQLLEAVLKNTVKARALSAKEAAAPRVGEGMSDAGQRYTRSWYTNAQGQVMVEYWLLHGAGHAWAGGSPKGTYTDKSGPDATEAMLRFFFTHRRGGAAS